MTDILSRAEKERLLEKLEQQFGISKLDFLLILSGQDKVRGYSGILSKEEIIKLSEQVNIETIGLYLFKIHEEGLRLTIDACQILKNQITKNIIEINQEQLELWLKGQDLEIQQQGTGFRVLKYKDDFVGCGKLSNNRITNFVPKERRIKN